MCVLRLSCSSTQTIDGKKSIIIARLTFNASVKDVRSQFSLKMHETDVIFLKRELGLVFSGLHVLSLSFFSIDGS